MHPPKSFGAGLGFTPEVSRRTFGLGESTRSRLTFGPRLMTQLSMARTGARFACNELADSSLAFPPTLRGDLNAALTDERKGVPP